MVHFDDGSFGSEKASDGGGRGGDDDGGKERQSLATGSEES